MTTNHEFFQVQSVADALAALLDAAQPTPQPETCATIDALNRVLLTPPTASANLPDFVKSTMDGYAVRAADTHGASESLPAYLTVIGTVQMGIVPDFRVEAGQAAEIQTGAMLPDGADAVVMIERTQRIGTDELEVLKGVAQGENLIQIGEDVREGAALLSAGHRIRPQDIGGLLALGITEIEVARAPHIAILSSGDELIPPEQAPQRGQIREINSPMLAALFRLQGATTRVLGIAADTPESLYQLAAEGLAQADMLVSTAGSSVSARDYTREVMDRLGKPGVLQHGLAVKPGKPTILAVCDGKPVIGLPGNPVSAVMVARQIAVPIIRAMLGEQTRIPQTRAATLTQQIASVSGREDSVPVRLIATDAGWQAEPIWGKSNLIYTLIHADGIVTVPLNSGGIKAGTVVDVEAF